MKHKPGVRKLASLPKRKAAFIEPMDCAPVTKLVDGPGWVYEIKLDGYRAIAVKTDGRVNLFSRRRKSFDHHYPLIGEALGELPEGTVVDGEIVALDDSGKPDFNLLQNFRSEAQHIHYFIFDLLIHQDRLSQFWSHNPVTAYERNPKARRACLNHYGTSCIICGFDFKETYGPEAKDFIHVHHLRSLSELGTEYVVDPVKDLRPVCPNRHSVIHLNLNPAS